MEYDPKPTEKPANPSDAAPRTDARSGTAANETPSRRNPLRGSLHDRPGRRRRWLLWTLPVVVSVLVGLIAGVAVAAAIHMPRVDDLVDFQPGLITELYDREGDTFATFARQRRVLLQEDEVSDVLRDALIAVEDANFYQHGGVDLTAVIRAAWADIRARRIVEGAGTLTMQLARQVFLTREQTWQRKIEEALLAVELEKKYTKPQILTLYINLVNLGHGNYGFASAARYYFDKDVADLNIAEAATLAGIVQRPSEYSPYRRPDLVKNRRDKVLRRMLEERFITQEQYREALASPLLVIDHAPDLPLAPYFAEDVRKYLEATYGTDTVHEGGLKVWATVDTSIQRAAEEALDTGLRRLDHRRGWRGAPETLDAEVLEGADLASYELPSWTGSPLVPGRWYRGIVLEAGPQEATVKIQDQTFTLGREGIAWTRRSQPDDLLSQGDIAWFRLEEGEEGEEGATRLMLEQQPEIQGAAVVLESATGAVRAMVGGWDFDRNKFNRVTQAARQVGSAFKPFVYGAALEMGYTPADTIFDAPTGFRGADGKVSYWPRNYTRSFHGIITLRYALEHSVNVPAVKLLDMVGIQRVIDFARRAGIEAELPPYPSLALGSADIPPIELASAYAAIANQGTWVEPYLIEKVTTADGRMLEQRSPITRTVTDPRVAFVLAHMMEGVIDRGTATRLRDLPIDIAGKTGTTNNFSDAWFVGFTPRYTILVWVGYDVKRSLGYGMTGSEAALPIWRQIAEAGLEDGWLQEGERFAPPPGVATQLVEYRSGRLPGEGRGGIEEAFVEGTQPVQQARPEDELVEDLPWYQQRAFYLPKEGENMTSTDDEGQTPLEEAAPAAPEPATPEPVTPGPAAPEPPGGEGD